MKLAISNIAWNLEEDSAISEVMQHYGVTGVEIAPTKIWPDPLQATDADIASYKQFWLDKGIVVSSMQALLFGHPELTIFESKEKRQATIDYLRGIIRLGGKLGAKALVFGSPKNRLVGDLSQSLIEEISSEFFSSVGEIAKQNDTWFCIEPNPSDYGCDFINTSVQGKQLVERVATPGFGLHLDAAGMTMSGEDIAVTLTDAISDLRHFHISEPNLNPIGGGGVDHALFASILSTGNYNNWYSVEMRAPDEKYNVPGVSKALGVVREYYG